MTGGEVTADQAALLIVDRKSHASGPTDPCIWREHAGMGQKQ
jgi:hypothetical protein